MPTRSLGRTAAPSGMVPAPPRENGERGPDQQVGGKQVERAVLAPALI